MLTETFLTYGQPEPPVTLISLRAGPFSMLYDSTSGFLRRIQLGEREVLRGIYAAVRDRNWGTTPGTIRESRRTVEANSFRIEFESEHRHGEIHFVWSGKLQGAADGTIRYEFDGVAKTSFLRNRIGFCVLHPIHECAGARAKQIRRDGSVVECRFSELIEPQIFGRSSFRDLRSIAHEITEGLWAELEFEGDTFEMEDQRNWTDASFKTYCTPLALPFPVEVRAGTRIHQAVTLRLSGKIANGGEAGIEVGSPLSEGLTLTIPHSPTTPLPPIGLGVASHGEPLREREASMLRQLQLAHLRADLRLAEPNWHLKLDQAASEAGQLGARLELAVHLPRRGDFDVEATARTLRRHAARLARVLALREGEPATSTETMLLVRRLLRGISVPVGSGSDCNFCELNREQALGRLALKEADFLFWSINPQVHATDHLSIMETLEAQAATVRSARAIGGRLPLVVSPVTLKQRFNPVATAAAKPHSPDELPPEVDARQLSQFAAAWTIGTLAVLTEAGAESVTLYETTGWRGVMDGGQAARHPALFPARPGVTFPIFDALKLLACDRTTTRCSVGWQNELGGFALFEAQTPKQFVLANLSPIGRTARWRGSGAQEALVALKPYQVICVGPGVGD